MGRGAGQLKPQTVHVHDHDHTHAMAMAMGMAMPGMKNYLVLNIAFSRGDVSHERTA